METKQCSKCGVEKALCEFGKRKDAKDGRQGVCKVCRAARNRKWERANKDKKKAYHEANREKILKRQKLYRQENKDYFYDYDKAYRSKNKDKIRDYQRRWRENNREQLREVQNSYARKKRKNNPAYRLKGLVSSAVYAALKNQGKTKGGSTFSALPYTPQDLVEHIEKQFDETMTWDNYGSYWDVDHIYPQSLLPYTSLEDENFQKCWALNNLQPLEKMANIRKSNKVL